MDYSQLKGYQDACKILVAHQSPRGQQMQRLADYVSKTQYRHLADWWSDKPIWERAPCVKDSIVSTAIDSNVDLVLGEGRFPAVTARPDEDDVSEGLGSKAKKAKPEPGEPKPEPPKSDSEKVDDLLVQVSDASRFRANCRKALRSAQGVGTAVGFFGIRNGRPFAETLPAQWCERELDSDKRVTRLTVEYPYYKWNKTLRKVQPFLYRRVIDQSRDVTFLPVLLGDHGPESKLVEDRTKTVDHALGFVPAIWYPFMADDGSPDEIDGHAVHEDLLDEIDCLNYILSQLQHAALHAEPQLYEIGVEPGYNPTATGRIVDRHAAASGPTGGQANGQSRSSYDEHAPTVGQGRKKGPNWIWQFADKDVKVGAIVMPEGALKAMSDHAQLLRGKLSEALAVVLMDPEHVKFAATVSGKAMEALRARQLDRCDQIRDDFGDGYILPAIDILLRLVYTCTKRNQTVDLGAVKDVMSVLDGFTRPAAQAA